MKNIIKDRQIKIGVLGARRGLAFADTAKHTGMELVAVCDTWETKLEEVTGKYEVAGYTDYDKFLKHDMDAVVVATPFPIHAEFSLEALEAGKHVLSETSCNVTMAEGVALCRKVEETGLCYMLAENYCFTLFNMEMRNLYQSGEIGRVVYAEGEYNHPMSGYSKLAISPGRSHWRAKLPPTYYNTHALAPLMYITDTMPVSVNALTFHCTESDSETFRTADNGCAILCCMDNGAVFRIFGLMIPGHSNWYRFHGTKGAMELVRGHGYFGTGQVRVWHDEWDLEPGQVPDRTYMPVWLENGELAEKAGHGGGDFWAEYYFSEAIRTGVQPYLDVYKGVAMSSVGILAWKSALENGKAFDIPDFTSETDRKKYENDNLCPFPDVEGTSPMPCCTGVERKPDDKAIELAKKAWKGVGYSEEEIKNLLK
jgi:predicted dehydrogenase